jgi:hypothetical protein
MQSVVQYPFLNSQIPFKRPDYNGKMKKEQGKERMGHGRVTLAR